MLPANGEKTNTIIQPITRYNAVEIQRGQLNQTILKTTPLKATAAIIENNILPVVPFKLIKQKGVYVPAININIIEWSSRLRNAMT